MLTRENEIENTPLEEVNEGLTRVFCKIGFENTPLEEVISKGEKLSMIKTVLLGSQNWFSIVNVHNEWKSMGE